MGEGWKVAAGEDRVRLDRRLGAPAPRNKKREPAPEEPWKLAGGKAALRVQPPGNGPKKHDAPWRGAGERSGVEFEERFLW